MLEITQQCCRELLRNVLTHLQAHHPIEGAAKINVLHQIYLLHYSVRHFSCLWCAIKCIGSDQPCFVEPRTVLTTTSTKVGDRHGIAFPKRRLPNIAKQSTEKPSV